MVRQGPAENIATDQPTKRKPEFACADLRSRIASHGTSALRLIATSACRSTRRALGEERHFDAGTGAHAGKRLHVAKRLGKNIARAREPRLVALRDRRAAETERDALAVGPIGDLAGHHHRAGVLLARDLDR